MTRMASRMAIGIQNGDNTHHHDQSMTWHNFNTTNAMPSRPAIPMPPLALLDDFAILQLLSTPRAGLEPATSPGRWKRSGVLCL